MLLQRWTNPRYRELYLFGMGSREYNEFICGYTCGEYVGKQQFQFILGFSVLVNTPTIILYPSNSHSLSLLTPSAPPQCTNSVENGPTPFLKSKKMKISRVQDMAFSEVPGYYQEPVVNTSSASFQSSTGSQITPKMAVSRCCSGDYSGPSIDSPGVGICGFNEDSIARQAVGELVAGSSLADRVNAATTASTIAFSIGIICLLTGPLKLGWLLNFVSNPVLTGFITGASIIIITG
ncbi:hypothetical protein HYALB_00006700 [Hymenoscyphus albidus]|uniref:SLC26A/SulP transporter domain-containing protein n=1 Tax=Hymenoscyphus albidus TaxID=595503 RepID=A0A9N9LGT3_9HELO|nr:hypothetical protein HYALB_00006700 [Hymenoscyphus albidus]